MSVIDDFMPSLTPENKQVIGHMYAIVRQQVPDATEELSYGMPAFKWRGKGLIAVMPTKDGLSLYPFCAVSRLGIDLSDYAMTSGSIHFSLEQPVPDELLKQIIIARQQQITA